MDMFNGPYREVNASSNSRQFLKDEIQPTTAERINKFLEADHNHVAKTRPAVLNTSTAIRYEISYF